MTTQQTRTAAQQQAQQARTQKEARSQQRVQQEVQQVAQTIQQQASNLTAVPLGAPLDPTKGFSFEPGARPQDLPMPGQAPGGTPERSQQSFLGNTIGTAQNSPQDALPDDHDAILGTPTQQPRIHRADPRPEHPILTKLRQDLGIDQIEPLDVEIGGHRWTMQVLTPGDVALAAQAADLMSTSQTERQIVYNGAVVSYAIVAIDGVPTYQVFGVEPIPGVTIQNHFRPPKKIRSLGAAKLFDFISDEGKTQLGDRLYEAYLERVDRSGMVESFLDDPQNKRVLFRCPEEGCGHELRAIPRVIPGTRDIQLPFCQWHGCSMALVEPLSGSPVGEAGGLAGPLP